MIKRILVLSCLLVSCVQAELPEDEMDKHLLNTMKEQAPLSTCLLLKARKLDTGEESLDTLAPIFIEACYDAVIAQSKLDGEGLSGTKKELLPSMVEALDNVAKEVILEHRVYMKKKAG